MVEIRWEVKYRTLDGRQKTRRTKYGHRAMRWARDIASTQHVVVQVYECKKSRLASSPKWWRTLTAQISPNEVVLQKRLWS